jgi:hypothetical protein
LRRKAPCPLKHFLSGKLAIFSAEKCKPVLQAEETEFGISQFKWFSEEEIEDLVATGLIPDMLQESETNR